MAIAQESLRNRLSTSTRERGVIKLSSSEPLLTSEPVIVYQARPLEPLDLPAPAPEPVYGTVTAKQWELWVKSREEYSEFVQRRNTARAYALRNDLSGVPFN